MIAATNVIVGDYMLDVWRVGKDSNPSKPFALQPKKQSRIPFGCKEIIHAHTHVQVARTRIPVGGFGARWPRASPTKSTIMNYYMRPEDEEARRQRSNTNVLLTALLVCVVILTVISIFEVIELLRFLAMLHQATTSIFGNGS